MTRSTWRFAPLAAVGLLSWACGGGDSGPTEPKVRTPTAIALVSGNNQTGIAGSTLPLPLSVRVTDAKGPIPDILVTFETVTGGGLPLNANRRTDVDGVATTGWQLGTQAGVPNQLRAIAAGLESSVTFSAVGAAGPPALVSPIAGVGQLAVVGSAVATPPRVQIGDAFGNPVPGTIVTFTVTGGGGTITGGTVPADGSGNAQVGNWVLGTVPGMNTLRATLPNGNFADITATGTAASLVAVSGNNQTANAGTLVPLAPAVQAFNASNEPLAGVMVTFSPVGGVGSVTGSVAITDAGGIARPGGWILGLTPGPNGLTAVSAGVPPVQFSATGVQASPSSLLVENASGLTAFQGNFLSARPGVRALDGFGNPVAGVPVAFDVVAGLGQVFGATAITDATGRARVLAWRLGQGTITNTLRATAPNLTPVTFEATGTVPPAQGDFAIDVRYVGLEPSDAQRTAFQAAVTRWQQVILGDLADEAGPIPAAGSLCNAVDGDVDDVVIFVRLEAIDGPGGVLGSAGPCWIRDDNGLTVVGGMRFDVADLASLEASGQLQLVILHEMGHVLGIGTLWRVTNLLVGYQSADPYFVGPGALTVFPTLFGTGFTYPGNHVPVENTGGAGTRDGHWREAILRNELMTGFLNSGLNPLSALSLVSLRDMGYLVNDAVGEFYEILPSLQAAAGAAGPALPLPPVSTEPIRRLPRRP
ncbi:MAG: hypothetical protein KJZ47_03010 [Gemmatimonadales bacterium]|nr:hypothetical protein [Gemmatimonadales bacterium]